MAFSNDSELSNAITGGLVVAVKHVVDTILEENDQTILDVVYSSYSPSTYIRTGNFQNAWETRASGGGKSAEGEFYFEPNKIAPNVGVDPHQHADIGGASVAEYMADIIYEGGMGCIYRPTNRDAWKVLDKWLTNTRFRQIFEEGLSKSGLDWKRSTGAVTKILG